MMMKYIAQRTRLAMMTQQHLLVVDYIEDWNCNDEDDTDGSTRRRMMLMLMLMMLLLLLRLWSFCFDGRRDAVSSL